MAQNSMFPQSQLMQKQSDQLTHSFPMHPFSTPLKTLENRKGTNWERINFNSASYVMEEISETFLVDLT